MQGSVHRWLAYASLHTYLCSDSHRHQFRSVDLVVGLKAALMLCVIPADTVELAKSPSVTIQTSYLLL